MTSYQINLQTIPGRDIRTNVSRDLLIAAKRKRIQAIQGWASAATMERERAELAKLEGENS